MAVADEGKVGTGGPTMAVPTTRVMGRVVAGAGTTGGDHEARCRGG